jgi:RNA polymerase sigma-70 factor (ECF subfamily)
MMQELGGNSDEQTIQRCLELITKLPEEQAQLIELRFFDKLSFQEIAQVYSITEANAKMRLYRILEKLKTDLDKFRDE